jgi:uncharacterized protein YoxC
VAGIFYLSILLIAIAFAVVVVYIAVVLHRISKTMKTVGFTLDKTEKEVEAMLPHIRETIHQTDAMLDDVTEKLETTDDIFETIDNVGTSVNTINQWVETNHKEMTDDEMNEKTKPFMEGLKWSEAAVLLYSKWKEQQNDAEEHAINQTRKEG